VVFVDVALVAVAVGFLLGGRLSALAELPVKGTWIAFVALLLQAVAFPLGAFPWHTPSGVSRGLWLLSYALLIAMLAANRRLRGVVIVAAGLACNLAAIVANGGLMPVRASALVAAGRTYHVHQNSIRSARPHLAALVDRWAVPTWVPLGNVFSVGDVLIALGTAVVIVAAMRAGRRAPGELARPSLPGAVSHSAPGR
jgi:hypothetical protein